MHQILQQVKHCKTISDSKKAAFIRSDCRLGLFVARIMQNGLNRFPRKGANEKNTQSLNVTANEKHVSDVRFLFSFSSVSHSISHALNMDLDQAAQFRRFSVCITHVRSKLENMAKLSLSMFPEGCGACWSRKMTARRCEVIMAASPLTNGLFKAFRSAFNGLCTTRQPPHF